MGTGRATIFLVGAVSLGALYYGDQPAPVEPARASPPARATVDPSAAAITPNAPPTAFVATVANEHNWRPDLVPVAWPLFSKTPGTKPLPAKTARQKIDAANAINARWQAFYDKKAPSYPTSAESGRAIDYLLTVDPKAPEFAEAWAAFVRLRQVDRNITMETTLDAHRKAEQRASKDRGVNIGMTADQIRSSSWGKPRSINETITARGKREQWVYGGGYLYLDDGVLTSIQTSR